MAEIRILRFEKKEDPVRKSIIRRHVHMRKVKIALECAAAGWIFGMTPYVFMKVEQSRGYSALGGELFFPVLALVAYWLIEKTVDYITWRLDERDREVWGE